MQQGCTVRYMAIDNTMVTYPPQGSMGISPSTHFLSSIFIGSGFHTGTQWQVSRNSDFTDIVHDSGLSLTSLIYYNLKDFGVELDHSTTYYVRLRHENNKGQTSSWSDPVMFTTRHALLAGAERHRIQLTQSTFSEIPSGKVTLSAGGRVAAFTSRYSGGDAVDRGMVSVFRRAGDTWRPDVTFTSFRDVQTDSFGSTVAISDDGRVIAVIDQSDEDDDTDPAVVVYRRTDAGWSKAVLLYPTDGHPSHMYGISIGISYHGDVIAVGDPGCNVSGNGSGCVHVFHHRYGTWLCDAPITRLNSEPGDHFGASVELSSDGRVLVVGAPGSTVYNSWNVRSAGTAHIFRHNVGWVCEATLHATPPVDGAEFGRHVSISGDGTLIAVSALSAIKSAPVTLYERCDGYWVETYPLPVDKNLARQANSECISLSEDGKSILIGHPMDTHVGIPSGYVMVYTRSQDRWSVAYQLTPSDSHQTMHFGQSLKLSRDGSTAIVSGIADTGTGIKYHTAYIYI